MMTSSDELDSAQVAEAENEISKSPSLEDLLEENAYLRSQLSTFYDQIAQQPHLGTKKVSCDCALRIKVLDDNVLEERYQNKKLDTKIENLQHELEHLQSHSIEQALVAKNLENKLKEAECDLHMANAELLQILPLRMKLNETNKKLEALKGETLSTNNCIIALNIDKDHLNKQLEQSWLNFDDMQNSFNNLWKDCQHVKTEKTGTEKRQDNETVETIRRHVIESSCKKSCDVILCDVI